MSASIGEVKHDLGGVLAHVSASTGGVEILSDEEFTLDPVKARNYAALLVRAADECERMRGRIRHVLNLEHALRTMCDLAERGSKGLFPDSGEVALPVQITEARALLAGGR